MHAKPVIHLIAVNSAAYTEMAALRRRVLLDPIGVPATYINSEKEKEDWLVAAYDGEQMVGCCVLTRLNASTLQLRQMAVDNAVQGKGISAAVIRYAEEVARENGFQTLMMHARDVVISFYERCGYAVAGPQFFEVGIAHHRMEKRLD